MLAQRVNQLGYHQPTPIQAATIPHILAGRDILGSAQTGTGKTASFSLPMIDILAAGRAKARMPRSIILVPTRELAIQAADSFQDLAADHKLTIALLIGGVGFAKQRVALDKGADVLVATPGRLRDHLERGKILLQDVKILVIDEADRMLDMGFIPDVKDIVGRLPVTRQTLFFSATLSDDIHKIGKNMVMNPKIVEVSARASIADTLKHSIIWGGMRKKQIILCQLLEDNSIQNGLIFCNRKRDIRTLVTALKRHSFSLAALHGDMTQPARIAALSDFKHGKVKFLIASDVAARGLDVPSVSHVFNYDVPTHAEDYVHRCGRAGRAGREGFAYTLATTKEDKIYIKAIETLIKTSIPIDNISDETVIEAMRVGQNSKKNTKKKEKTTSAQTKQEKTTSVQAKQEKITSVQAKQDEQPPKRQNHPSSQKSAPEWDGDNFITSDHVPQFLR